MKIIYVCTQIGFCDVLWPQIFTHVLYLVFTWNAFMINLKLLFCLQIVRVIHNIFTVEVLASWPPTRWLCWGCWAWSCSSSGTTWDHDLAIMMGTWLWWDPWTCQWRHSAAWSQLCAGAPWPSSTPRPGASAKWWCPLIPPIHILSVECRYHK